MTESTEQSGRPLQRREDRGLLTGSAVFTDDIDPKGLLYCSFLRSDYAHADLEEIDTRAAEGMEGVESVITAEDVRQSDAPGVVPIGVDPPPLKHPDRFLLAEQTVHYQGEPIAAVLARDRYRAADGVEALQVRYERREPVLEIDAADTPDSPQIHDCAPDNTAMVFQVGDAQATEQAFEEATHVVTTDHRQQRVLPNAMEPRAAVAEYDAGNDKLTLHCSSQTPHAVRLYLSRVLGVPENRIRVQVPEVGGGFGSKDNIYPEEAFTAWCARELNKPVKWTATRKESYLSDAHGRAREMHGEMALDEEGTITGLRVRCTADLGAYVSTHAPIITTAIFSGVLSGPYEIPAIDCEVKTVYTNRVPVDSYRGAGRPEACYLVERLVHRAARRLAVDPAELRRENFIPPDAFPYQSAAGPVYDSGNYPACLDKALEMADYEQWRNRQDEARDENRYLGVGMGCFVESAGAGPADLVSPDSLMPALTECGLIRFHPSGVLTAYCGTKDHGQGHRTTYAQILSDKLGVPMDDIEIVEGDTDEIPFGTGSFASRSTSLGGGALVKSADKILEKARTIASHQLEVSPRDLEFEDGAFFPADNPDDSIPLQQIARDAYNARNLPDDLELGLESSAVYDPENFTYPHGAHVCVVEVEPETGDLEILDYVAVDDCGNQINPMIVEGQIQGGVAQGIGQALFEEAIYDESGNLRTGTMKDYVVPEAAHVPEIRCDSTVTPSPHNPLGAKGCGEAGSIGAPPAVINAVLDALEPLGVEDLEMPANGETLWKAI